MIQNRNIKKKKKRVLYKNSERTPSKRKEVQRAMKLRKKNIKITRMFSWIESATISRPKFSIFIFMLLPTLNAK